MTRTLHAVFTLLFALVLAAPAAAQRETENVDRTLTLQPGGRLQSFLAVEELTDMLPLHEAVPLAHRNLAPDDFARWKRGLTAALAAHHSPPRDHWPVHGPVFVADARHLAARHR